MLKVLLCLASLVFVPILNAQATYAASARASLQVGVTGSAYTLDYGEGFEEGISIYGDLDFTRHLGLEGIYRNASIETPKDIGENHLLGGPRYHVTRGPFQPYAKALVGEGIINFQKGFNAYASSQHYFIYDFGGGVDFRASRHVNVRLIDFEYQLWPNFGPHGLTPYGFNAGAAYHF